VRYNIEGGGLEDIPARVVRETDAALHAGEAVAPVVVGALHARAAALRVGIARVGLELAVLGAVHGSEPAEGVPVHILFVQSRVLLRLLRAAA